MLASTPSSSSSSGACHQSVCSRPRCRPDISYQDILYQIFCFQDIPRQMTDILSSRYLTPITLILIISRYPIPDIFFLQDIPHQISVLITLYHIQLSVDIQISDPWVADIYPLQKVCCRYISASRKFAEATNWTRDTKPNILEVEIIRRYKIYIQFQKVCYRYISGSRKFVADIYPARETLLSNQLDQRYPLQLTSCASLGKDFQTKYSGNRNFKSMDVMIWGACIFNAVQTLILE